MRAPPLRDLKGTIFSEALKALRTMGSARATGAQAGQPRTAHGLDKGRSKGAIPGTVEHAGPFRQPRVMPSPIRNALFLRTGVSWPSWRATLVLPACTAETPPIAGLDLPLNP